MKVMRMILHMVAQVGQCGEGSALPTQPAASLLRDVPPREVFFSFFLSLTL